MNRRAEFRAALFVCSCALAVSGCNMRGLDPPTATMNYPFALGLDEAGDTLIVVNSNFDLRFNQGTVQALDLDVMADMTSGCGGANGPCQIDDFSPMLIDEVALGSHAQGLARSPSRDRFYLPVRSDTNLTFIDWSGDELDCGAEDETETGIPICGESHRSGNEEGVASDRELTLDGDPVAIAAGSLTDVGGDAGDYVMMAMREGRVALFIDQEAGDDAIPELVHIVEDLTPGLMTMTIQPTTGIAWITNTSVAQPLIDRVAIEVDPGMVNRSFLFSFGPIAVDGLDDGGDSRDIAFHPERPTEEAFVLSRRPEAVVTFELDGASGAELGDLYEVGVGPSRIDVATIAGTTYVFASCFEARRVFVIDADHGALIATLGGFSGPFEMAVDAARESLYLADFTTSVIRVINLAPLRDGLAPEHIATIGVPTPPPSFID
jgi:hypothetical protein